MKDENETKAQLMKEQEKISSSIYSSAFGLSDTTDFPSEMAEILSQVQSAGLSFSALSFYLIDAKSHQVTHYFLYPAPAGWETVSLAEDAVEARVFTTQKPRMQKDSSVSPSLRHLTLPTRLGVVAISDVREEKFSPAEQRFLEQLVQPLEVMITRYRDLDALEMEQAKTSQIDSDLMALYDGSFKLLGETQDEVVQKIIQTAITLLSFDRAGIFLRDAENNLLRGAWGVDEQGEIVPIPNTVFPIYPERPEELAEAARIARGELEYFLTSNLDGEGRKSLEGDIKASVSVPMQIGHQIIGMLAADNYFTDQPIMRNQVTPLQILANIGAVAFENARLYQELRESYEEVFQELQQRLQAEESLKNEHRLRQAGATIRIQIAKMNRPQDLCDVVKEISVQLEAQEIEHDACSIQLINSQGTDFVSVGQELPEQSLDLVSSVISSGILWPKMTDNAEVYPWVIDVWKTGEPRYIPSTSEEDHLWPGLSLIDVPFSQGTIAIHRKKPNAYREEEIAALQYFADVLSDGFQRFIDITERKRQEIWREALQRVRDEIWKMKSSEDIEQVVRAVQEAMQQLNIPFCNCGVNVMDPTSNPSGVRLYTMLSEGEVRVEKASALENPAAALLIDFWHRQQVAYRKDLSIEDLYGERAWFTGGICILDVPFSHGTLAVSSDQADVFSQEDIEILQQMAQVLSEGFQRQDDFLVLEQRNRELEKEMMDRKRAEKALRASEA